MEVPACHPQRLHLQEGRGTTLPSQHAPVRIAGGHRGSGEEEERAARSLGVCSRQKTSPVSKHLQGGVYSGKEVAAFCPWTRLLDFCARTVVSTRSRIPGIWSVRWIRLHCVFPASTRRTPAPHSLHPEAALSLLCGWGETSGGQLWKGACYSHLVIVG